MKLHAFDRYATKYPLTTASFHVRRTEGTMPTGRSFSAFQKLWTPAPKRVRAIFGAGFILRKPRHDHLFVNFSAMVAAVFGDFEQEWRHGFYVWSPQLPRVSYEALYQRFGFVFVHLEPCCTDPGAFGKRTGNRAGDDVFRLELRTRLGERVSLK